MRRGMGQTQVDQVRAPDNRTRSTSPAAPSASALSEKWVRRMLIKFALPIRLGTKTARRSRRRSTPPLIRGAQPSITATKTRRSSRIARDLHTRSTIPPLIPTIARRSPQTLSSSTPSTRWRSARSRRAAYNRDRRSQRSRDRISGDSKRREPQAMSGYPIPRYRPEIAELRIHAGGPSLA